jgi:hypothetical protein
MDSGCTLVRSNNVQFPSTIGLGYHRCRCARRRRRRRRRCRYDPRTGTGRCRRRRTLCGLYRSRRSCTWWEAHDRRSSRFRCRETRRKAKLGVAGGHVAAQYPTVSVVVSPRLQRCPGHGRRTRSQAAVVLTTQRAPGQDDRRGAQLDAGLAGINALAAWRGGGGRRGRTPRQLLV